MILEGYRFDFPHFFHFVDDEGDHREIEPSGGGTEMQGKLNPVFQVEMKLEVIQIYPDRGFRTLDHFSPCGLTATGIFGGMEMV